MTQTTRFIVQPNQAAVGANAVAQACGIHQDGVLKARDTCEIMRAEDLGWSANRMNIIALMGDESVTGEREHYRLLALSQHSEMGERPQASVAFAARTVEHHANSDGNGPVDASLKAIESKVKSGAELLLYSVNAITSGNAESQGGAGLKDECNRMLRERYICEQCADMT